MTNKYDVIIIGAGVIGAAIARELSRYHLDVAVLEKETDVSFGVSKANSGIIHAGFHAPPDTLKGKLAVPGNRKFDRLCEELDFPFERNGELMVAFSEDEIHTLQFYYDRGKKNNVPYLEMIGKERLLELEPNLNPDVECALYAPSAGVICPYEYCFALIENAKQNGVNVITGEKVIHLEKKGKIFEIKTEKNNKYSALYIVNAAGLFADEIARMVGITNFKIVPRKGEEYLLDRRVGKLVKRVIFPCPTKKSKGMLIIPTVDGPVMVGPTALDIEDKVDFSTTRDGLKQVFNHAQKLVPSIRSTDAITSFVGLRPAATRNYSIISKFFSIIKSFTGTKPEYIDGDFIIGRTTVSGFINAAGIQSPGLTASPIIAEHISDALLKDGLKLEKNPAFNPIRKRRVKHLRVILEKKFFHEVEKLVKENKKYSNLVCRCENVTEAEIVDAIKMGHTTLDGIKFATRAGTGRCQSGFCTTRILDLIHQETGIPVEKITKKGPGSEIVLTPLRKGQGNS